MLGPERYLCWLIWVTSILDKPVYHCKTYLMAAHSLGSRYEAANESTMGNLLSFFLSGRLFSRARYHLPRTVSLGDSTLFFMRLLFCQPISQNRIPALRCSHFEWANTRTCKASKIRAKGLVIHDDGFMSVTVCMLVKCIQFRIRRILRALQGYGRYLWIPKDFVDQLNTEPLSSQQVISNPHAHSTHGNS